MLIISIKDIAKKEQHTHAHKLLRECLKKYNINYNEETKINKTEMGKPSLADYPEIKYNISHADGIASCIVTDKECGIDCEQIRPYRPNVVKRAFSDEEKILLENTPDEEKNMMFFRLWTLKESYVKAIGTGISYPLNTVSFSFENGKIKSNIKNFKFKQYIIKSKYAVSVCIKETDS